ncbi:MAG: SprT family zinc-dependent metalloprotease [Leptolyngbyaceae bacterium]|nr:SprT family zinc-dependent metalloprotease [Leptolyngbyaceae bacterium]
MVKSKPPHSAEALSRHPLLHQFQDYRIRESRRAKHVSIKISTWGDVEVVVPRGVSAQKLVSILNQRTDWIQATKQRILSERGAIAHEPEASCPTGVFLRAINETWTVDYIQTEDPHVALDVDRANQHLQISGHIEHPPLCHTLLGQWIRDYARLHFVPWLERVSQETQLPFNKCVIRRQKTRWASCSSKHNINLNDKLLFLPRDLVDYVFIHELCHTVHLNHSKQFWALVEQKETQYRTLDQQLRTAWRYVPRWLEKV